MGFILTLTLSLSVLAGCNLFEQNTRKDYMQVVATVNSIEETQKVGGKDITFKSEPKNIYKYELVSYLNQNSQTIQNMVSQGESLEDAVNECLENLVTQELVFMEADRLIAFKEIEWRDGEIEILKDGVLETVTDYTDYNAVKETVYDAIDSTLVTIRNEILSESDNDLPTVGDSAVDGETTYPVKPSEEEDSDEVIREEEAFSPDKARWPGYYGDAETKAMGREMMRRFIELLRTNTDPENNYAITKADTEKFAEDDEKINKVINEQGIEYVYPMIFDTHYMRVLLVNNAEKSVKLQRIQEHISGRVTINPAEVQASFDASLRSQELLYADVSNFNSAIKGGSEEILYFPTSRYFYVKHILLPFSDEQKAKLTARQNAGTYTEEEIEAYRDGLVSGMTVFPHLNGEDDMRNPMTVEQVWTQIKSAMKTVESSAKDAERLFDDFIYLYNTDNGIFNNAKGYVVESALEDGESETYMQEFADGARELKNNAKYKVGMLLDNYVVTDYGDHIMYYANDTYAGKRVDPSDWQTPGQYKTYYDIIEETLRTEKEEAEFETWRDNRIVYYQNIKPIYKTYANRYKDLYNA